MKIHKAWWWLLGAALLLGSCSQANHSYAPDELPAWSAGWGGQDIPSSVPLTTAFFQGTARSHTTSSGSKIVYTTTPLPPDAVSWLVASSTFGFVVVRDDPAGTSFTMVLMSSLQTAGVWTGTNLGLGEFERCAQGAQSVPIGATTFPAGTCPGGILGTLRQPALFTTINNWSAPSHIYLRAYLNGAATRPADATSITISGFIGWQAASNGFQSVVVPLSNGQLYVFACLDSAAVCANLATQGFSVTPPAAPTP